MSHLRQSPSGSDIDTFGTNDILNRSRLPGNTFSDALDQVIDIPPIVSVLNTTIPAPIVVELLPAGHTPGLYIINQDIIVTVSATGGVIARLISYSAPGFGLTSYSVTFNNILVGHAGGSIAQPCISSTGVSPITLTFTSSLTGSPVFSLYLAAVRLAVPFAGVFEL